MLTAKNKNKIKYIVRFLLLKLWNFRNAFQDDWSTIAHQEGRLPFAKRQLEQSKKDGDGDSQTWVSLGALLGLSAFIRYEEQERPLLPRKAT